MAWGDEKRRKFSGRGSSQKGRTVAMLIIITARAKAEFAQDGKDGKRRGGSAPPLQCDGATPAHAVGISPNTGCRMVWAIGSRRRKLQPFRRLAQTRRHAIRPPATRASLDSLLR